ncbi:hypothetical protein KEM54_000105 [Ascosphaera aggregata]|nr:hypothetical protein KEM54_000105 [Ascosphaera aggregata]
MNMVPFVRSWSPGRFRLYLLAIATTILLSLIALQLRHHSPYSDLSLGRLNPSLFLDKSVSNHGRFWKSFQPILDKYAPTCNPIERGKIAEGVFYNPNKEIPRPDLLTMKDGDVADMKIKHTLFVQTLQKESEIAPFYQPDTRGIVTTAGGRYLPVFTVSLRMLRRTGCELPVEVFLASHNEYEPYICDVVFKNLNAKCVVLDDILAYSKRTKKLGSYQFKPLAMLFSSFEDLLFLDADAFPLRDPNAIFDSELFQNYRMITWPDFWGSSASPLYYKISSQKPAKMSERASTESGEIFISKKSHRMTLLLSTYYNYHGPNYYYRLFSQGAAGEGDKETFLAAAQATGEQFYQVTERIAAIGHRHDDGTMAGSAMVQFDPIEDYALTSQGKWRVKNDKVAGPPRPFFIHANVPKFNPATILDKGHAIDPVRDDHGKWTRPWSIPENTVKAFGGFELEKVFWTEIKSVACEYEKKFRSWRKKTDICKNMVAYYDAVFEPKGRSQVDRR